jgi:hypothetical protein
MLYYLALLRIRIYTLHFNPDPVLRFNADPDPTFTLLRIRIRISDYFSTDPAGLHFEPPRLHCDSVSAHGFILSHQKLLNLDFNAYPDQAFRPHADPDPASKK